MEHKGIKPLLIAILVALVLLLIPAWGIFLSGLGFKSAGAQPALTPDAAGPLESSPGASGPTPAPSAEPTPTPNPFDEAAILGEPDEDGWIQASLPFFKEPVLVKPTMKEPNVAYITAKVGAGMELTLPGPCWFRMNGDNGYIFSKKEGYTPGDLIIQLAYSDKINFGTETGFQEGGLVLGIFPSDGEVTIMTPGLKPQAIEQTDVASWCNKVLALVLGG